MISRVWNTVDSPIGLKVVVALTGIGLIGFVIAHMLGNLQIFAGADALNGYAAKLKDLGILLWAARIGLLAAFVVHIAATIRLSLKNRQAQPERYAKRKYAASSSASRTMVISGLVVLAFVIFHLLHFTFGVVQPSSYDLVDAEGRHDVYSMVVAGFQNWFIVAVYAIALTILTLHLSHAMFSVVRTLGGRVGNDSSNLKRAAQITAVLIVAGFLSVPLAVILGIAG